VVIVIDAVLVASRRPRGLDASDQSVLGECPERVINGLARNGADLGADDFLDVIRRAVRAARDRAQHGESLSRYLKPVLTKYRGWIGKRLAGHEISMSLILDSVKSSTLRRRSAP
jgi:hypothetical protein